MSDPASSGPAVSDPDEPLVFPPTLREVMLRPRWIAMLLLCLVVAGIFSWLLSWQLERAIDTDPPVEGATEAVLPIDEVAQPGEYLDDSLVGQRVEVEGQWVPEDFVVVSSRFNDGVEGYWVTGQLRVADAERPTSVAVALGWTESREEADAAVAAFDEAATSGGAADLTGRIIADEGPQLPPGDDPTEMIRMSPAALLGVWHDTVVDGEPIDVYRQYLTSEDPVAGLAETDLVAISSPAPEIGSPVNWLNLFYAAEWAIFAAFSFYLWYRLAKDAREREIEELTGGSPDDEDDLDE
ncbi:SURF1 family protein [Microbacterium betulae]|uniref:SURF1-like protein n=1 Tax=Microbacterium betulae TaxID=2981139 RepID=A0AA97FH49_9MICO|nr:SURF1 family cytochrome oxidase biogenesis protein [Microbacterium sp. AB]WOF22205.1 SURF1 family protein [Microbacterium sp. AB]